MSTTQGQIGLLRKFLFEVLTGFMSLNAIGRDRAIGNIRWGDKILSQRNKGIFDDVEEMETHHMQDLDSLPKASCVYVSSDMGKVLAVSRPDDPNSFGFPGGKVELGEEPINAAARELKEETGLDVENLRLLYVDRCDDGYLVYTYTGDVSGKIRSSNEGKVKWVKPIVLLNGPFGAYNTRFFNKLKGLLFCTSL